MAAADTTTISSNSSNNGVSRREIQAAISKAVELRALHAALMQGSSPANNNNNNLRHPSTSSRASPVSRPVSGLSAQDYPVFTPSYEDEPPPGYQYQKSQKLSESWDECGMEDGEVGNASSASRKILPSGLEPHVCPADDQKSPQTEFYASSRRNNNWGDFRSVSSCNRCKPAVLTAEFDNRSTKNSNIVVPLTDIHSSVVSSSQPRNRGVMSWLFPKLKKKHKNHEKSRHTSPHRTDHSEEVSQVLKDLGVMSVERLKRELMEANESRDAALLEVSEMKSSLGELSQKLKYLENYCEGLKRALKQATLQGNGNAVKLGNFPKRGSSKKSVDGDASENSAMPVSEEVMVEGFLQIVSEARLSVKQFLKTLVAQIDEDDTALMGNLNSLLQPYNLTLNSKYSKTFQYHLEAIINQSLYQDFENCIFQKNGAPKLLDPEQDRQAQFSSFVALRNLSWNEVLQKGTKYYSEEFSKFCDQKMSQIITTLNWTRPWPEQLLQAFFVAAKCIWLLHLLAFSFNPPLGILRVEGNLGFDPHYMEDMVAERQRSSTRGPSSVKVMVMPGFYVHDRVLRCKVLCRYKSLG